ncbi:unnamed protein product [Plutella xylostella]|uniref:(diamondback moth) hypothetical protein n=1 Tax=Plutella xylostella TaxID=51655 RepID=A0A8S4F812_PLUXY|nr:unnamed protein product [Plutella xylostella]
MDNLQVLRLLLAVAIVHSTVASSTEPTEENLSVIPLKTPLPAENAPPTLIENQKNTVKFREAHKRKMKEIHGAKHDGFKLKLKNKVKRQANRRSWTGYKNYGNPPPYLVYNKKIGAYYPYYKFPIENNVRRSGARNTYSTISGSARGSSRNYVGS